MFKCILVFLAPDSSRDDDAEAEHYLERCFSLSSWCCHHFEKSPTPNAMGITK
jgi:hypothetical protein